MRIEQFAAVAAIVLLGMLLGSGTYESVVLVPNFGTNLPSSLEHLRLFMSVTNPGIFFRIVSTATQLALLCAFALSWRAPGRRSWYVAAFVLAAAGDVITSMYHYPRNALLFGAPLTHPASELATTVREWGRGNVVRIALVGTAMLLTIRAFWVSAREQAAAEQPIAPDAAKGR